MPAVVFQFDAADLGASTRALERALDDELEACVVRVSEDVEVAAKTLHGFVNRSGRLGAAISAVPPAGSFLRGTLHGAVIAATPYAVFIESRPSLAFLGPAWTASEARAEQHLGDALERAVVRSGLT